MNERINRSLSSLIKHFLREVPPNEPNKATNKGGGGDTGIGGKNNNTELLTARQQHALDYCMRILGRL